jgi:type VI secretion system protein ImpK
MTTSSEPARKPESLPLIYQEVLTAIVRLRGGRQAVAEPNTFRHYIREALKTAARQAMANGWNGDDVKHATFAVVAFLDESVLNSKKEIFADWLRKPLQEELFGTHVAGDSFFQHIQELLGRNDSMELADLLEVHYLCLLLGYGGRYSANRAELKQIRDSIVEKIQRARGPAAPLAPSAAVPEERVITRIDPWIRRLAIVAIASVLVLASLFTGYKLSLNATLAELQTMSSEVQEGAR